MSDVPPVPADDPGPPPAPPPHRGTQVAWAAGVGAAIVIAGVVAFVAGQRVATPPEGETTTTTVQPVVTAGPGWSRSDAETVGSMALALEQSSATKALSTATILAVERCGIPLGQAASQLDTVLADRRRTIDQLKELEASGGMRTSVDLLIESLERSLVIDEARVQWVDWLATEWVEVYSSGCWPPGEIPTEANLEFAQNETANAAAVRSEFLTLFNPLASAAGLRTWDASEF